MESLIRDLLVRHFGADAALENAWQLSGGATRQTWGFEASGESGPLRAVLQLASGDDPLFGLSRRAELEVLEAAARVGVPLVPMLAGGELSGGRHYLLTAFVEGESRGSRIVRSPEFQSARAELAGQVATALARIHSIQNPGDWFGLERPTESPSLTELERYERQFRASSANPHPVLELTLRWLRRDPPKTSRWSLVHGDFRVGNLLLGPEGLRAVLDWELCHWGDPLEDLGWLMVRAWRFGSKKTVGGFSEKEEFLDRYSEVARVSVDPEAVRWWEVFGNFRWAVLTIKQSYLHLSGVERSVELASLGRLTAETEWELLHLIED